MPDPAAALPRAADSSTLERTGHWFTEFILKPLRQIVLFIVLGAVLMTVCAYIIAILSNTFGLAREGLDMVNIVNLQLVGMLLDGVTIGFVYAMIALGYTMVYGVLRFINFAHSEIFMVGSVVGYEVFFRLNQAKLIDTRRVAEPLILVNVIVNVIVAVIVAALVCGLLAMFIERVAYRPLRNAPKLVPLISAIGVSLLLQDFIRGLAGIVHNQFFMPYPRVETFSQQVRITEDAGISGSSIFVIIGATLMVLGLNYFVNATRLGKGIRAVSQDQPTAALMGINVNAIIALTFFIGGALGGVAGVLFGMKTSTVNPYIGFLPGLKAFTAAVLGGIGNITGALLGGILLGLIEAFFSGLLPYYPALGNGYRDVFAFSVLVAILIFRPTGLLGERVDEKV
jgi:branched-chain amino acid transport system permease protein